MRSCTSSSSRKSRRRWRLPRAESGGFSLRDGAKAMSKSMTGFASLTHEDERATIAVTVRAVNHRFLDLQLRLPQAYGDVEPRVRSVLQKRLARGRVELGIAV